MPFEFIALFSMLAIANAGVISPVHYTATPVAAVAHKVAYASPAVDSVASTHQNVVRSFGGTVSTYSKAVDSPYSSVRKADTRISNNVYTPAIQKTLAYATAPVAKTFTYAPAPVVEKQNIAFEAPLFANTVRYTAPVIQKPHITYAAPVAKTYLAPVHSQSVVSTPAVYTHPEHVTINNHLSADQYTSAVPKDVAAVPAVLHKTVATYAAAPATTTYNHGSSATTYSHNAPGISGYGSSQVVHYSPAEMVSHMSFDGFGTHWGY